MAFSSQGYSNAVARLSEDSDVPPKMLIEFLRPFQQMFAEVATDRSSLQQEDHRAASLTTSRQIVLPVGQVLDTSQLSLLKQVLDHEQSLANRFAALMEVDVTCDKESDEEIALRRCAVREMLYYSTNAFVRDTLLVAADSRSPQSEQLLDDFFEVSQTPNQAEYAFLADVTGFEVKQIQEYFANRRDGQHALFVARSLLCSRGRVGWQLRKRHLDAETQSSTKKKPRNVH